MLYYLYCDICLSIVCENCFNPKPRQQLQDLAEKNKMWSLLPPLQSGTSFGLMRPNPVKREDDIKTKTKQIRGTFRFSVPWVSHSMSLPCPERKKPWVYYVWLRDGHTHGLPCFRMLQSLLYIVNRTVWNGPAKAIHPGTLPYVLFCVCIYIYMYTCRTWPLFCKKTVIN